MHGSTATMKGKGKKQVIVVEEALEEELVVSGDDIEEYVKDILRVSKDDISSGSIYDN